MDYTTTETSQKPDGAPKSSAPQGLNQPPNSPLPGPTEGLSRAGDPPADLTKRAWDASLNDAVSSAALLPAAAVAHSTVDVPASMAENSVASSIPLDPSNGLSLSRAPGTSAMDVLGSAPPLEPNVPASLGIPSASSMTAFPISQESNSAPTGSSFPIEPSGNISNILNPPGGIQSSQPMSQLASNSTEANSDAQSTHEESTRSGPSVSEPTSSQPPPKNGPDQAKDPRGVGEIGAASGLYMLSQSHGDTKSKQEGTDSREISRAEGSKRKHDVLASPNEETSNSTPKQETNRHRESRVSAHQRGHDKGTDQGEPRSDHESDTDSKRKNFLERNRQAAFKCRQRKKAWLASLQAKVEYLQSDNESLQNTVEALRAEVVFLKSQLMQHHAPSQMDGEPKEGRSETGRPMASYAPLNVNDTNAFVSYSSHPNVTHSLMTSMPAVSQTSAHEAPSLSSAGLENPITNVSTSIPLPAYTSHGVPRMTQIPATQPLLPTYTQPPHAYPTTRGTE